MRAGSSTRRCTPCELVVYCQPCHSDAHELTCREPYLANYSFAEPCKVMLSTLAQGSDYSRGRLPINVAGSGPPMTD